MKKILVILCLASVLILSACSEDKIRPSASEIKTALTKTLQDKSTESEPSVLNCQAEAIFSSELSDEALRVFVSKENDSYKMTKKEETLFNSGGSLWEKLQICRLNK